ncbi:MAG: CPBP family glutamic-type intramembrane protease [Anaerolineaceae bacterium]|nr:CPBP family glutamic-type intramembrane protease [Anaerolineaceae bacterium]
MEYLNYKIRKDWIELDEQRATEYTLQWRLARYLVLVASLVVLLTNAYRPPWPWQNLLVTLLTWVALLTFVFWANTRASSRRWVQVGGVFTVLLGTYALALLLATRPLHSGLAVIPDRAWLGLLFPLSSGILIAIAWRRWPVMIHWLGLHPRNLVYNLLIGLLVGGALSFHLMVMTYFLGWNPPVTDFSWDGLLWSIAFQTGLRALSEEVFFRGLCFHLLYENYHKSLTNTAIQITLLNALLFGVLQTAGMDPLFAIVIVFYRAALSALNVFLRYRLRSIVPGLAANIVFSVLFY